MKQGFVNVVEQKSQKFVLVVEEHIFAQIAKKLKVMKTDDWWKNNNSIW